MIKHEELRKLLDDLNAMEKHEASVLVTEILKYIMDNIQPERSKREDLLCPSCHSHRIEYVTRSGNVPLVYCKDCKDEVMEEDLIRCGALNSMET